ncbi:hypothetical protein [Zavarzinella formosa]|uniref:hypothetical protein n=1 Tax=Zavarzinella formosa TaxID=360055 RepID=UPI0002FCAF01|nr:hypothetical protein [Zavarzinella formosa]
MKHVAAVLASAVILVGCGLPLPAPVAGPANDPLPANGLMFQPPEGWRKSGKAGGVVFFDAPGLKPGQECRIAVGPPRPLGGGFEFWFGMVQEPAEVVEESPVIAGTGLAGARTLRITKVVEKGINQTRLHRVYHGIEDGDSYALLLLTASDKEAFRACLPAFDAMAASWHP